MQPSQPAPPRASLSTLVLTAAAVRSELAQLARGGGANALLALEGDSLASAARAASALAGATLELAAADEEAAAREATPVFDRTRLDAKNRPAARELFRLAAALAARSNAAGPLAEAILGAFRAGDALQGAEVFAIAALRDMAGAEKERAFFESSLKEKGATAEGVKAAKSGTWIASSPLNAVSNFLKKSKADYSPRRLGDVSEKNMVRDAEALCSPPTLDMSALAAALDIDDFARVGSWNIAGNSAFAETNKHEALQMDSDGADDGTNAARSGGGIASRVAAAGVDASVRARRRKESALAKTIALERLIRIERWTVVALQELRVDNVLAQLVRAHTALGLAWRFATSERIGAGLHAQTTGVGEALVFGYDSRVWAPLCPAADADSDAPPPISVFASSANFVRKPAALFLRSRAHAPRVLVLVAAHLLPYKGENMPAMRAEAMALDGVKPWAIREAYRLGNVQPSDVTVALVGDFNLAPPGHNTAKETAPERAWDAVEAAGFVSAFPRDAPCVASNLPEFALVRPRPDAPRLQYDGAFVMCAPDCEHGLGAARAAIVDIARPPFSPLAAELEAAAAVLDALPEAPASHCVCEFAAQVRCLYTALREAAKRDFVGAWSDHKPLTLSIELFSRACVGGRAEGGARALDFAGVGAVKASTIQAHPAHAGASAGAPTPAALAAALAVAAVAPASAPTVAAAALAAAPTVAAVALASPYAHPRGFLVPGLGAVHLGTMLFGRDNRPEKAAIFEGPLVPCNRDAAVGARQVETVIKVVSLAHEPRFELEVSLQRRASLIACKPVADHAGGATWLAPAVLAVGYGGAFAYLMMERVVDGDSLYNLYDGDDSWELQRNVPAEAALVRDALASLAHACILFPDHTPHNFMRGRLGGADAPKSLIVIDFGGCARDVNGDEKGMARARAIADGPLFNIDMK